MNNLIEEEMYKIAVKKELTWGADTEGNEKSVLQLGGVFVRRDEWMIEWRARWIDKWMNKCIDR